MTDPRGWQIILACFVAFLAGILGALLSLYTATL